jgi:hypothetical protein
MVEECLKEWCNKKGSRALEALLSLIMWGILFARNLQIFEEKIIRTQIGSILSNC